MQTIYHSTVDLLYHEHNLLIALMIYVLYSEHDCLPTIYYIVPMLLLNRADDLLYRAGHILYRWQFTISWTWFVNLGVTISCRPSQRDVCHFVHARGEVTWRTLQTRTPWLHWLQAFWRRFNSRQLLASRPTPLLLHQLSLLQGIDKSEMMVE